MATRQTIKIELQDNGTFKTDGTDSQMTDQELAEILAALAGEVSLGDPAKNVKTEKHVHRPGFVHSHERQSIGANWGKK